jgi:hypothetical protein
MGLIARRLVRRKRLARRPRLDLEFFFSRYERNRRVIDRSNDGSRPDLYQLESRMRLQDRR